MFSQSVSLSRISKVGKKNLSVSVSVGATGFLDRRDILAPVRPVVNIKRNSLCNRGRGTAAAP